METVFKVGDMVFDFRYGWGVVERIEHFLVYPIRVDFLHNKNVGFTFDGNWNVDYKEKSLSFTEYDLVNGGFSQERPLPKIEVDTLVYVRYSNTDTWVMRYFSHYDKSVVHCFNNQMKSTNFADKETTPWKICSLTNPLENESNKK